MRTAVVVFLLIFLSTPCLADRFTDTARQLPACGLSCILSAIPKSACHTITNTTCICADDSLFDIVSQCVHVNCTVLEAIDTARIEAKACQRPRRSRKKDLLSVLSVEILAFLCVLLRLFSRWYAIARFELDDYIMIVAAAIYLPFVVVGQIAGAMAFGEDIWTVDEASLTTAFKLFYIAESFYLAIINLTKLSILCFYLRIFPNQTFRRLTFAVMAWVGASGLIFISLQIFQCTPIEFIWKGWSGGFGPHHCLNINALVFTAAGFSIAQDVIVILLPIPLLANLQASLRVRLGVILMFSLGIFVLITSCARLRAIVLFARSTNPTWDYVDTLIWTGLECAVSVIVTSLPAIRALAGRLWPGGLFRLGSGRHRGGGGMRLPVVAENRCKTSQRSLVHCDLPPVSGMGTATETGIEGRYAPSGEESQLELGTNAMGQVRTEVGAGHGESGGGWPIRSSSGSHRDGPGKRMSGLFSGPGIRVQTTTTTRVRTR